MVRGPRKKGRKKEIWWRQRTVGKWTIGGKGGIDEEEEEEEDTPGEGGGGGWVKPLDKRTVWQYGVQDTGEEIVERLGGVCQCASVGGGGGGPGERCDLVTRDYCFAIFIGSRCEGVEG